MKREEIHVGRLYTNGRGKFRRVFDAGAHCILYPGQADLDCLAYRPTDVQDTLFGPRANITRTSFASWAKAEVKEGER